VASAVPKPAFSSRPPLV